MSTQVPPSRLDSTKDFSSLVPSAFAKANAAFAQANNATDTWVRTQANNAYSQANAAFTAANTASGAAASSTPKISAIVYPGNDTAAATSGGQTVTLNGSGFNSGASVLINGTYASVVSVANSTSLSFTTPANSGGTYILYVINTDGGTGISVPGISYSGTPAWSNAAGSLATVYETANISSQLTATGDAGDLPITYSVYSGTLPPGSSLNSSTGLLSGTSQSVASSTTYNFVIRATDAQNQDTDRSFSITLSPDVVTWSSPADNSTTTAYEYSPISNVTMSATSAAGKSITFTANSLPTGVTITGNTISGTPTVVANTNTRLTANSANTFKTATKDINFVVNPDVVTWSSPADGTSTALFQNQAMSNVTLSATSAAGKSITYTANTLPTGVTITGAVVNGTPTTVGTTNSLITATATTTNRTATRNFTWVVSVANDTFFKNTTLLLNGETTVTPFISDASTNSFGLTIAGDTKPVLFNPYTPGYYSAYFPSSSSISVSGSNANLSIGTSDFTIELWAMPLAISDALCAFITSNNSAFSAPVGFLLRFSGTTAWQLIVGNGSSDIYNTTASFATYGGGVGVWTHHAIVRSSGTLRWYVNGTQAYSVSDSTAFNQTYLGFGNYASYYWNGYLSNFRIVKGTGVYTAAFTPPTSPLTAIANTSILVLQSNRLLDNSSNAMTLTSTGSPQISPNIPFTASSSYSTYGSTYFDGTGDYLSPPDSSLNLSTSSWCIEYWMYPTTISSGYYGLWACNSSTGFRQGIYTDSGTHYIVVLNGGGGYGGMVLTAANKVITTNTWFHVALACDGTTIRQFVNGALTTTGSASTFASSGPSIGSWATANYFNGYMSDFRVVKGSAVYTSAFTPPTSPLTAITNTSLLTLQYNGGATNYGIIDNSNYNNIITRFGNATQGTFSPYSQTGWSNYFNGGSYITTATSSEFTASGNGFTIEAWVYYVTISGYTFIVASTTGQNNYNPYWFIGSTPAANWRISWGDATAVDTGVAIATNTWNHVALVMGSNGSGTFYLNGVSRATTTGITLNAAATGVAIADGGGSLAGSYLWPGYISNVRYVKNSSVYTGAFTPSTTPLTPISGTSLLTCQSNRFIDNSLNNIALTITSVPQVQAFSPFGSISEATPISYSNYFDGTGDYSSFPNNSAFAFGTGSFTIEFWINAPLNNNKFILSGRGGITSLHITTGGYNGNTTAGALRYGSTDIGTSVVVCDNTWHHCAIVRNGSSAVTMYVDGVSRATTTDSTNYTTTTGTWYVATNDSGVPGDLLTGYLSNLRIVKGTALYTTTFTPSTTPLTTTSQGATASQVSLLTCQSTRMIDNSTNAFTITAVGDTKPKIFNPFGYTAQSATSYTPSIHGGSMYLDGTGDYINAGSGALVNMTGDFTVEMWIYGTNTSWTGGDSIGATCLVDTRDQSNATENNRFVLYMNSTGSYPNFYNAGTNTSTASTIPANVGMWNHIAYSRSGSTIKIFVNGVQGASFTDSTAFTAARWVIGMYASQSGGTNNRGGFIGYISDHRVVKYAVYTSNFVPPSQTLGNYSTTYPSSLLLNFTNGGIVDQHGSNVLETVGNAQLSTAVKKYNVASMSFNNSTQYLTIAPTQNLEFGSGDFTIEFWWYPTSTGRQALYHGSVGTDWSLGIDFNSVNTQKIGLFVSSNGSSWNLIHADSGGAGIGTTTPTQNAWNHIAVTRSGTTFMLFVGGNRDLNITGISGSIVSRATSQKVIGSWWNTTAMGQISGYIDDFRITKGYARYTANFTPPTTALITK